MSLALLTLMLAPGCARALREPAAPAELAGSGTISERSSIDTWLRSADRDWAERSIASVRRAADARLRAAAADPGRRDVWIGAARALVWLADHVEDREVRKVDAMRAVDAAQWCGRAAPGDPACDYWLAAALGIQARERRTTGHDALPRIVELLERAIAGDPLQEHAGPHRVLALVYLRAPGWPAGPGDADLGLDHARRAVELCSGYPPNQLALGEALVATERPGDGRRAYRTALDLARTWAADGDRDAREWIRSAERALGLHPD